MSLIDPECFSEKWVLKQREKFPLASPGLIEKSIYAFELLGLLIQSGKPFVFKGGTSLLLLLPELKRLSIDVDIIGDFNLEELETIFRGTVFTNVEENERKDKGIPKRHFKMYYPTSFSKHNEYVMLDTLAFEPPYPIVISKQIKSELFEINQRVHVDVPSINSILGDKMTVFAPHTIGVPFGADKSMQVIKQLFDIGELFIHCNDLTEVRTSFERTGELENSFRKEKVTVEKILDDTIRTAYTICYLDLNGSKENEETAEIRRGVDQIASHLLKTKYGLLDARISASRTAFLSVILRYGSDEVDPLTMFFDKEKFQSISGDIFTGKLQSLTKLKKMSPESFYFWRRIAAMSDNLKETEL